MSKSWLKFDGSEEHRKLLRDASDFRLKLKDGTETALINGSCEFAMIDQILICERHPHADMIIEWARTGRPVYEVFGDGSVLLDEYPMWLPENKYTFDPPAKEKLRYRLALMKGRNLFTSVAYTDVGVEELSKCSSFVRWLTDWQEVEA